MKLKNLLLSVLLFIAGLSQLAFSQTERDQFETFNGCITFANESIHGMLIAHRLFENYNQDINNYVDLPGHQLNFYNNNDLPLNIFEDPEQWFYETSPLALFHHSLKKLESLPESESKELIQIIQNIESTCRESNNLRLTVGESINTADLRIPDTLYGIYNLLEKAVDSYDLFNAQLITLEDQIQKSAHQNLKTRESHKYRELIDILNALHDGARTVLLNIKNDDKATLKNAIIKTEKNKGDLQAYSITSAGGFSSPGYIRARKRILDNLELIIKEGNNFLNDGDFPEEYAHYGRSYYFYNTRVINKFNRYGNGLVQALNQLIDIVNLPMIHRLELPHYLKIIYPDKVEKKIPVIEAELKEIINTPEILEDRTIVVSDKKHVIYVDGPEPTLEIFDHLKQDGDIVSLNYNGRWIFENLSLERKPQKFILQLNRNGKNYLILHAVNEGNVPPNTIGINYTHKGRKKRYIMESNLKTSQLVEIKIN